MNPRLLIITVLCIFCASFFDAAGSSCSEKRLAELCTEIHTLAPDTQIEFPEHGIIVPRQTNYASSTQIRTVTKRQSSHRLPNRYIFFTAGKAVDKSFIETYQLTFQRFPSGLMTPYRHHLSIGILII